MFGKISCIAFSKMFLESFYTKSFFGCDGKQGKSRLQ